MGRAKTESEGPAKRRFSGFWDTIRTLIYAVLAALIVRTVAIEPFNIPSGSMIPTLLVGDYLFVSKYAYGYSTHSLPWSVDIFDGRIIDSPPDRGDVAVFKLPRDNSTDYIKRIVGLPGDRLQVLKGVLHINGTPVIRERIDDYSYTDRYGRERVLRQYRETLPNGVSYMTLGGIEAHRRRQRRALRAPVVHQAGGRDEEVVLGGDGEAEGAEAFEVVGGGDEAVLDRPPRLANRVPGIGLLVGIEDQVDGGVAHRVRRDAPAEGVQFVDDSLKDIGGHRLEAVEGSSPAPRLLVGVAHPSTLESPVNAQLDAAHGEQPGRKVGPHAPGLHGGPHLFGRHAAQTEEEVDPHRQPVLFRQTPVERELLGRGSRDA